MGRGEGDEMGMDREVFLRNMVGVEETRWEASAMVGFGWAETRRGLCVVASKETDPLERIYLSIR